LQQQQQNPLNSFKISGSFEPSDSMPLIMYVFKELFKRTAMQNYVGINCISLENAF